MREIDTDGAPLMISNTNKSIVFVKKNPNFMLYVLSLKAQNQIAKYCVLKIY